MLLIGAALFVLFIVVLYILSPLISPKPLNLNGSHVLVTGGSSGIGRAVAVDAAKRGANVTLLARNQGKLSECKADVINSCKDKNIQKVKCISVDISKDHSVVEASIRQAEEAVGPVDMLVNCAGTSVSGRFEETNIEDFKHLMDLNYFGSVYATRAVVQGMKEREHGRIVFTSSFGGQLGLYGYTAYSASKFALRGLAESLYMELKPYNVYVSMAFPPDTETPGFVTENETKPEETRLISESAGLFQPDQVAKAILDDAVKGKFLIHMGLDGYMVTNLTCGMSPVTSIMEATQQVATMGLFRVISLFYLDSFDRIIKKCKLHKDKQREKTD